MPLSLRLFGVVIFGFFICLDGQSLHKVNVDFSSNAPIFVTVGKKQGNWIAYVLNKNSQLYQVTPNTQRNGVVWKGISSVPGINFLFATNDGGLFALNSREFESPLMPVLNARARVYYFDGIKWTWTKSYDSKVVASPYSSLYYVIGTHSYIYYQVLDTNTKTFAGGGRWGNMSFDFITAASDGIVFAVKKDDGVILRNNAQIASPPVRMKFLAAQNGKKLYGIGEDKKLYLWQEGSGWSSPFTITNLYSVSVNEDGVLWCSLENGDIYTSLSYATAFTSGEEAQTNTEDTETKSVDDQNVQQGGITNTSAIGTSELKKDLSSMREEISRLKNELQQQIQGNKELINSLNTQIASFNVNVTNAFSYIKDTLTNVKDSIAKLSQKGSVTSPTRSAQSGGATPSGSTKLKTYSSETKKKVTSPPETDQQKPQSLMNQQYPKKTRSFFSRRRRR